MNKQILQWLKDELESNGTPKRLTMDWDDLDKLFAQLEKKTGIKLK